MVRVAVTDYSFDDLNFEKNILEPLGCKVVEQKKFTDEQSLKALVADADYVITQFAPVTKNIIDAMTKCRVICRYGIGVDNVDLDAAAAKKIPVCNIPDYCTNEVADHTLALILSVTRQIPAMCGATRKGIWKSPVPIEMVKVLSEMTVGVIGFGRIGREVAKRLAPFKCKIMVYDPIADANAVKKAGFIPAAFSELLQESDLITLHCPSTAATRHMLDAKAFAKMKTGVLLVNASRGDLIKTEDLIDAINSKKVAAAGLDVTSPEPLPAGHPLLKMDNVLIAPHQAAASVIAVERLRTGVTDPIVRLVRGEKLINIVNGVKA